MAQSADRMSRKNLLGNKHYIAKYLHFYKKGTTTRLFLPYFA